MGPEILTKLQMFSRLDILLVLEELADSEGGFYGITSLLSSLYSNAFPRNASKLPGSLQGRIGNLTPNTVSEDPETLAKLDGDIVGWVVVRELLKISLPLVPMEEHFYN